VKRSRRACGSDSGYEFPKGSADDPVSAVLGVGCHVLGEFLGRHGFVDEMPMDHSTLHDRLRLWTDGLVADVENGLGIESSVDHALPARIAKVRSKIHKIRTDTGSDEHPEIDGLTERAILALRIHGYNQPYLTTHPTIDRYAENGAAPGDGDDSSAAIRPPLPRCCEREDEGCHPGAQLLR
jgi:hypothetical protein